MRAPALLALLVVPCLVADASAAPDFFLFSPIAGWGTPPTTSTSTSAVTYRLQ